MVGVRSRNSKDKKFKANLEEDRVLEYFAVIKSCEKLRQNFRSTAAAHINVLTCTCLRDGRKDNSPVTAFILGRIPGSPVKPVYPYSVLVWLEFALKQKCAACANKKCYGRSIM